ncbi:pyridoxal-phosphate dependent enzyme [Nocardiopsis sp. RSe5-2]|uniref:Pyridoxal-phosphate dependent enzyme n=1 Tax=Nocardiopsis endophytica TaxID=3018445 RepID=A0ABT4UDU5_9ACTN|nr:pyridoxal-phosphate dependent enzyme [Nocardiopsis endophytica]MDA2815128.1 pyridoxal-phosphate dependent enzyme [Nocardiopsis endophytica]
MTSAHAATGSGAATGAPAPGITDVLLARRLLRGRLAPTPLRSYPALDRRLGARVLVKHENLQPTGAFKVRGGLVLLSRMTEAERARGVVTYSTGNHAQSIAYAARATGAPCTVVVPEDPNPVKAEAVRALGADLVEAGSDLDGARVRAEAVAAERGARLVSPGDEPDLIAGVATAYLELFEEAPDLDAVIVPVGGGSGAAGACIAAAAVAPGCRVIGVQSDASPAAHDSWRAGACTTRPNRTRAEGLATGRGFALPQSVLRDRLDDFVLVGDEDIRRAQWWAMAEAGTVAEGAGAAALAGAHAVGDRFRGGRIAVVCTGGNASPEELRRCTASE